MKSIDIKYKRVNKNHSLLKISNKFKRMKPVGLDVINWESYPYLPEVAFKIFYTKYAIYINFTVTEQSVLAKRTDINSKVHKDSCVEFFLEPGDGLYHNFEFNAIGTIHAGAQTGRDEGYQKGEDLLKTVRTYSTLGSKPFDEIKEEKSWSLVAEIPFETFTNKKIGDIRKTSMKGNFYKCGDELSEPHYVSWNNIDTENPDFHRPECFGVINFK